MTPAATGGSPTRPWSAAPLPVLSADDDPLLALVDGQPIVARLLKGRGFTDAAAARAFLDPDVYQPAPLSTMPDLDRAVGLLRAAIDRGQKILIWGDFDVDGQTATALLIEALGPLTEIAFHIPDRARDSHGVQVDRLREQIAAEEPHLLITCDTGITAHDGIGYAKAQGLTVIITDHHEPEGAFPPADAVINPHRLPADHPLGGLPGVGVAFVLIAALYAALGRSEETAQLLDLVALGIVADLAPQYGDTRYYLQRGLAALRETERIGLLALVRVAGVPLDSLTEEDIAFQIGPRLNAASRMGDARTAVALLTTVDAQRAEVLAQQVDQLNMARRTRQKALEAEAEAQIGAALQGEDSPAIIAAGEGWDGSLLGPVAGRLAERYGRPVILFTQPAPNGPLRGSARAPAPYHLVDAIGPLANLLTSWGGHAGAAGLALRRENFEPFRRAALRAFAQQAEAAGARPALNIDADLPLEAATPAFARALARLAPFGVGNPAPTFAARGVTVHRSAYLDRAREHQRLTIADEDGATHFVTWWNSGDEQPPLGMCDVAYRVALRVDRRAARVAGEPSVPIVSLSLVDIHATDAAAAAPAPRRQVIDLRGEADPRAALAAFVAAHPDSVVWAEGLPASQLAALSASAGPVLGDQGGAPLVIYSAPASQEALAALLRRVDPPAAALIGTEPPAQSAPELLRQLAGLVRTIVRQGGGQEGSISAEQLCARCAQGIDVLRIAVRCLEELGFTEADTRRSATWTFRAPTATDLPIGDMRAHSPSFAKLDYLLTESAAYRQFFRTADAYLVLPARWLHSAPPDGQPKPATGST